MLEDSDSDARRIYLADFGIARRVDDAAGLTATNVAVGTVAYAAPEQLMGEPVDWAHGPVRAGLHGVSPLERGRTV